MNNGRNTSVEEVSILRYLADHSLRSPDSTAFIIVDNDLEIEKRVTFAQLETSVKLLACRLMNEQLEGQRVLLVYQDTLEFIITFLACQYCGIIPVPVPYVKRNKQISRLFAIIEDAQAAAIFCASQSLRHLQQGLSDLLNSGHLRIILTDAHGDTDDFMMLKKRINEIAFIQYTSGSTGKPKGVVITGKNLLHNQLLIRNTFGCDNNSVIFSWVPFHHDMGLIGNILHTIYVGCTCILMSPLYFMQTPRRWLEGISKYKATHSGGPNFSYDLCSDKISADEIANLDLSCWRVAYNGSEPVRAETMQRFADRFRAAGFSIESFFPCYGLAEATLLVAGGKKRLVPTTIYVEKSLIANNKITLSSDQIQSAQAIAGSGSVAQGMNVKIIGANDGRECNELEEGEICISADSVMNGYWNKNNDDFFYTLNGTQFFRTGDLGFVYQDELFVHGRLKEVLIIRGENIFPSDIEEMVSSSHQSIENNGIAIFKVSQSEDEVVIVAEIKRTFLKGLDAEAVVFAIDNTINGSFGIDPYDIVLTTPLAIPRTTSGKLQRLKCKEDYCDNAITIIESKLRLGKKMQLQKDDILLLDVIKKADAANIAKYLINLIESKVGKLSTISVSDSAELAELGIDSLRAMELINTINKDLNINVNASQVLRDNSLLNLVTTIENMLWLKNSHAFGEEITI